MALLPGFSELFAPPLRSLRNPVGYVHVQHDQFHEIFWTYRSFVGSQYFPVYDQPRLCLSCHFSKTQCCEQPPWPVPPFSYRWQAVVRQCLFQFWIIWYHLNSWFLLLPSAYKGRFVSDCNADILICWAWTQWVSMWPNFMISLYIQRNAQYLQF